MAHIVVLQDWTIEIQLSEDGESVSVLAEQRDGLQFHKTFCAKKRRIRRSASLRRRKDKPLAPLKGELRLSARKSDKERTKGSPKVTWRGDNERDKERDRERADKDRERERSFKERERGWERDRKRERERERERGRELDREREREERVVRDKEKEKDPDRPLWPNLLDKEKGKEEDEEDVRGCWEMDLAGPLDPPPRQQVGIAPERFVMLRQEDTAFAADRQIICHLRTTPLSDDVVISPVSPNIERKIVLSANRSEKRSQHKNTLFNEEQSGFFKLPQEVQVHIFSFLSPSQLSVAQKTCSHFRALAKDDLIWKGLFLRYFGGPKKRGRTWRQESMSVFERVGRHTRKHQAELLLWGAKHGHTRFVENLLLNRRVNPNTVKRGSSQASPLHLASHEGHLKMVKLLLAYKAEVNARTTYGRTPLERAAKNGHKKVVELLLANNADVNAATCGGETPLLVAASGNHKDIVRLLLAHGADVNTTSQLGFTALRIATLQGFAEIVSLLSAQQQQNGNGT